MLKILHLADSHIGVDLPARPRKKMPRRGEEIIDSYHRACRMALAHEVDLVIHAGDVFDLPTPSSAAIHAAAQPLLDLAVAGIPVFIIPGNHERSCLPESLLWSHANITVVTEPLTRSYRLNGNTVAISGFPCVRRESAGAFAGTLDATGWSSARADLHVLVAHQTFASAVCGPADYRFRSGDNVIDRDAVPDGFDYVAAGHVHRHQIITAHNAAETPIVYAGSPDRIAFAERGEPKGAVLVRGEGDRLVPEFLAHDVRPMEVIPLDVTGLKRGPLLDAILGQLLALPEECYVLLRLTGRSTRKIMQNLDLAGRLRVKRPGMTLHVSARDIEYARHAPTRTVSRRSAFDVLDAPEALTFDLTADRAKLLPRTPGNYVLRDAAYRLLYIGKATNLRTRVQAHLRGTSRNTRKRGNEWTRQIARVEVRIACSDMEALLAEADLIRKHRPPFNRQMRMWSRYCYICVVDQPWPHLAVMPEPVRGAMHFGPYRSQFFATELVAALNGLFGLPEAPGKPADVDATGNLLPFTQENKYSNGHRTATVARTSGSASLDLSQVLSILGGEDNRALLESIRAQGEMMTASPKGSLPAQAVLLSRLADTLERAQSWAAGLNDARALLDHVLLLPGPETSRTLVFFSPQGPVFDRIRDDAVSAADCLRRHAARLSRPASSEPLGKSITDGLITAVRTMQRPRHGYRLLAKAELLRWDGDEFRRRAMSAWPE